MEKAYHMVTGFHDPRRKHERKIYRAEIMIIHHSRPYQGTLKDISIGGAFVTTKAVNQFSVGDVITLDIPFTAGEKNVRRRARILWQNNIGFGVEFF
jgi:hypothetical protein